MLKRILYIVLFLSMATGARAQFFVAEFDFLAHWDEVSNLTAPSTGQFKLLGQFFDRDGRSASPSDIIPDSNYYFIDAGENEYLIRLLNSSSPFVIEVDPVGHSISPRKGIGQLTQKTSDGGQYYVTGGIGDRLRAFLINKGAYNLETYIVGELAALGAASTIDTVTFNNDTLKIFTSTDTFEIELKSDFTTATLNGTDLELAIDGNPTQIIDLTAVAGSVAAPITAQSSAPIGQRQFWKDIDTPEDSARIRAPYKDEGYKELAYHHEMRAAIDSLRAAVIVQGKAIIDTIPLIVGITQARLDSMKLIGVTFGTGGVYPSTAARDTLYPDAFIYQLHGGDSMIIAYSGILVFPDSVFNKGVNYYQPYDFKKYQASPDTILEQLVFKAIDTNKIEIRDRYSYLAEGKAQSSRTVPTFNITYAEYTDNELKVAFVPNSSYMSRTGNRIDTYTDPISGTIFTNSSDANKPDYVNGSDYINFVSEALYNNTGGIGASDTISIIIKIQWRPTASFDNVIGSPGFSNYRIFGFADGAGDKIRTSTSADGSSYSSYVITKNVDYIHSIIADPAEGIDVYSKRLTDDNVNSNDNLLGAYTPDVGNFNQMTIGARSTGSDKLTAYVYGVYVFEGTLTAQEAIDLVDNWDIWHMRGL